MLREEVDYCADNRFWCSEVKAGSVHMLFACHAPTAWIAHGERSAACMRGFVLREKKWYVGKDIKMSARVCILDTDIL